MFSGSCISPGAESGDGSCPEASIGETCTVPQGDDTEAAAIGVFLVSGSRLAGAENRQLSRPENSAGETVVVDVDAEDLFACQPKHLVLEAGGGVDPRLA